MFERTSPRPAVELEGSALASQAETLDGGAKQTASHAETLWAHGAETLPSQDRVARRGDDLQGLALGGGDVSARYEVLEEVGRGGMGVVYRARHRTLEKQVAIKVLLPGAPQGRFLQEARILAKIDSPHVVEIHDFDILPERGPVLVMEWINGLDLARLMRAHEREAGPGGIEEDRVIRWMRDTARGMHAAAEAGIIHRDLKPSNIFVDGEGAARVVDFGLARGPSEIDEALLVGQVLGSPWYMAPEQAEDPRRVDTRADIYSFGATFYHALTGRPAFDGGNWFAILHKHKSEPLTPPRSLSPGITARTSEIIERCMAKSPSDRFSSFAEVLAVIDPVVDALSPWDAVEDVALRPHLERYRARRARYLEIADGTGAALGRVLDVFSFPGERTLTILCGDLVEQDVEALVSSDDQYLSMRSGVSRAIRTAAGEGVFAEAQRYVPVRAGRAVVTSAGELSPRFVFHGITLRGRGRDDGPGPSRDLICEILGSCIYHAETLGVRTMALPLLATGNGGFSREICLDTLFRYLARELLRGLSCVRDVRIVLY
ncbi:MAG: serine/threonine-protein kinase [Myxococcales bacterium]|nr:serine/threonine-protein kinase [Myxococcales bacterium]